MCVCVAGWLAGWLAVYLIRIRLLLFPPVIGCVHQDLTASFGWERGEAFQQNDVQEVLCFLQLWYCVRSSV